MLPFPKFLQTALLCAVFLPAAWWLAAIETDAPYISTEVFQQVYLTDEGLYTKGSTWFARHGELHQPKDFSVAVIITPFYSIILGWVMQLLGDSWHVARAFSIFMSFLAIGAFWTICRSSLPVLFSALATLSAVGAFQYFHSARLATADPTGIAFCLLSAAAWVRWRSTTAGTALALLLGLAALFSKTAYAPFWCALAICVALDIAQDFRRKAKSAALGKALALAGATVLLLVIRHYFGQMDSLMAAYVMQNNLIEDLGFKFSIKTGIRYMASSLFVSALLLPGVPVLVAAALFPFVGRDGVRGFWASLLSKLRLAAGDPILRLFTLWGVVGGVLFGLTSQQGARYYLYIGFICAYMAFWALDKVSAPPFNSVRMAVLVTLLHLASQANFYLHWYQQDGTPSYIAISRDIAAKITADKPGKSTVLGHGLSDWVSLFDRRITGVDYGYDNLEKLMPRSMRIRYWRPDYVIVNEDDVWLNSRSLQKLLKDNADLWAGVEPISEYRLLFRNSFPNSPENRAPNLKLMRFRYR